jgi:hypothetical protein
MVRVALLPVRAASRRPAVACGPEGLPAQRSAQVAPHLAKPVARGQVASAARLLLVESGKEEVVASVPDASEARLPRVEAAAESELDVSAAWPQVVARPQVAAVVQVESDAQAQPAAPDAAVVQQPVAVAAWDARAVLLRAVAAARHAVAVQEAAVPPDAVVRQRAAEPVALGAAEVLRVEVAQHAVAPRAEARPAARAAVQAVAQQADPLAAASVCRQDRLRPAVARRPAARSVLETRHLQTASPREQSSQAAQDVVWS